VITVLEHIYPIPFYIGLFIVLPAAMISGWAQWAKQKSPRTSPSVLSLIGFALACLSGLLMISAGLIISGIVFFQDYDPLLKLVAWGGLLSILGFAFAIAGAWRRSPLPWYALSCSLLVFLLSAIAGMGE
jgi:hypothetical protein